MGKEVFLLHPSLGLKEEHWTGLVLLLLKHHTSGAVGSANLKNPSVAASAATSTIFATATFCTATARLLPLLLLKLSLALVLLILPSFL